MTYHQKIEPLDDITGVPPETIMLGYVLIAVTVFWGIVAIWTAALLML